jgi:hypothetical protein
MSQGSNSSGSQMIIKTVKKDIDNLKSKMTNN